MNPLSIMYPSIHPLSIMYPYPLSCLDYASIPMDPLPFCCLLFVYCLFVVCLLFVYCLLFVCWAHLAHKALRVDIGPRVQNDFKSLQIQASFRVDFGSPFVHLTKFHRFSASFFGARLFILAISAPNSSILLQFDEKRTFLTKGCRF